LVRFFSSARIITNIDGFEWRREKWRGLAKRFLRFSERMAVLYSHEVISDNVAIAEYVKHTYGVDSHVIGYGGDHAVAVEAVALDEYTLPESYAFSVCRMEPENNVHVILEAFSKIDAYPLVMVGNWNNSKYGHAIRERYTTCKHLYLLDPIYDLGKLKTLRSHASFYIHGHSAGGTNPSLVEAMHFGKPVLAFDCNFNRNTTEDKAFFFKSSEDLVRLMATMDVVEANRVGGNMLEIAERLYTWSVVAQQYFALLS
jgi:glycosyltransferase involved in cell wall biosynthesis